METRILRQILEDVRSGKLKPEAALSRLRHLPFEDLGFAKIDHHRRLRTGMPEVIFSQGKSPEQVARIFQQMAAAGGNVLATKAGPEHFRAVRKKISKARYREQSGTIVL